RIRAKGRVPPKAKRVTPKKDLLMDQASTSAAPVVDAEVVARTTRQPEPTLDRIPAALLTRILRYATLRDRLSVRATNRELECRVAETDLYCDGIFISQNYGVFRWSLKNDIKMKPETKHSSKFPRQDAITVNANMSKAAQFERIRGRLFARAHALHVTFNFDSLGKKIVKLIDSLLEDCTYKQ
ncbi:hypothetical protein PFISCL1PPCAC_20717, partial [Pristionchus fissidentatus]